jgi:hypothetical protein
MSRKNPKFIAKGTIRIPANSGKRLPLVKTLSAIDVDWKGKGVVKL